MDIIQLHPIIESWNLEGKRVLLRADLNVPIKDGKIIDDYRLCALQPTLSLLRRKGAKIILATHLGRPDKASEEFSTRQLIPWFEKHKYKIVYESNLIEAYEKSLVHPEHILLLENMRFFSEKESANEKEREEFAIVLAGLGDYYVGDAFALLHRTDTSTTLVPLLFKPDKRSIGLLIEQELEVLNTLISNDTHPFIFIFGGNKLATKIPLLKQLFNRIDTLLLGPAPVFSFLHAQGKSVGKSLIDEKAINECTNLLKLAQEKNVKIIFPIDYVIADNTFEGPLHTIPADQFPADGIGVTIGPKTVQLFAHYIIRAQRIFYNGLMGDTQRKETLSGVNEIFTAMSQSAGMSVIGGGDSVAAAQILGLADKVTYCSTGGGATLAYLSGEKLPGLQPFIH